MRACYQTSAHAHATASGRRANRSSASRTIPLRAIAETSSSSSSSVIDTEKSNTNNKQTNAKTFTTKRGENEEEERAEKKRKGLSLEFADDSSLKMPDESSALRNFWYPVTFVSKLEKAIEEDGDAKTVVECTFFGEKWVIKRRQDFETGEMKWVCMNKKDEGKVLPSQVQDGLFMVWPGKAKPSEEIPEWFKPPSGYTVHAELVIENVPVDAALLMENLLDLAHAPFTHTGTFAKGWGVPNMVEFATKQLRKPGDGWHDMATFLSGRSGGGAGYSAEGSWKPYPIDMKFITPCMVDSHIGMAQPGAAGAGAQFKEGDTCTSCEKHLHQLHVCVPQEEGKTRLLYRMSLDFAQWAKWVPGIQLVWVEMANQVLGEDLRLVEGQQDRMNRGGRVWANPVQYDKIGLVYRNWRNHVVKQEQQQTM